VSVHANQATNADVVQSSRRRLSPESRRREILDAAVRVLRERGPGGCRVEDITAEARTAKGNFYRYFSTWDDLLVAVRDHVLDCYRDDLARRYAEQSRIEWWKAMDEEIDRFLDFQLGLGGLHEAIFHGPPAQAQPIDQHRSAASILAGFLTAGISEGAFAPVDVEAVAPLVFDVLHGAADAIASGMDDERVRRATRHIVHRALEPHPSDHRSKGRD
jgi:AcrR family transcriptional regulator